MSIAKTRKWLEKFILKYNICPYAEGPYRKGLVRLATNSALNCDQVREIILQEVELLNELSQNELSNTFICFPKLKISFIEFYQFVSGLQKSLESVGVEEFILVPFHPQFVFKRSKPSDFSNFVNRSPFPSVHLLRRMEFELLSLDENLGKKISLKNKKFLNSLTVAEQKKIRALMAD